MELPALPWDSITGGGLAIFMGVWIVWMVVTRRLIPVATHEAAVETERRRADASERKAEVLLEQQSRLLVPQAKLWEKVFEGTQNSGNHVAIPEE